MDSFITRTVLLTRLVLCRDCLAVRFLVQVPPVHLMNGGYGAVYRHRDVLPLSYYYCLRCRRQASWAESLDDVGSSST